MRFVFDPVPKRELAKRVVERSWQINRAEVVIRVRGECMKSVFPSGSAVRVRFSLNEQVNAGAIVYLRKGTCRFVHRLLWVCGPFCLEKGDDSLRYRICLRPSILGVVSEVLGK
jgi:hypothetical protein